VRRRCAFASKGLVSCRWLEFWTQSFTSRLRHEAPPPTGLRQQGSAFGAASFPRAEARGFYRGPAAQNCDVENEAIV
jgi:hypothetical protein